jgi:mannitol/fructose-specific phosphotransferase system IIA component
MSMLDSDEQEGDMVAPGLLDQVRTALQEACEIVLPSSSKASVFLRDLLVAASQIKASRPANGQELQPVPIYMSTGDDSMSMTKEQAESLVATKAVNPVTKKPWAMEDLGFKTAVAATTVDLSTLQAKLDEKDAQLAKAAAAIQALVQRTVQDTKAAIQTRVNKLIASGIVSKEYADAHFAPKLDYQMSTLQDGSMAPHPLEVTLSALEQLPAINKPQPTNFDGFVQPAPFQAGADLSGDELNKAIDEMLAYVN